ncbi:Band 4.1-like protein 5 [Hypsibius exemplaris]|uniref:Band 4.1-like protein 5 n=1 Tax=Hypsibius exemplaris TaxID=2072580 RepID=A0A9X6NHM5_HYPEX|nr:Band 4.1-like protein 5 [Hypsibius exemplaris]
MGLWQFLSRRGRSRGGVRLANGPDTAGSCHVTPKGHVECMVQMLDGEDLTVFVPKKSLAQDLINEVAHHLELGVERDYFGLQFSDTHQVQHWLDPTKTVKKQIKIGPPYSLRFRVKLFPPNPQNIREDLTKYLFFLHLKQDIQSGRLVCPSDAVAADLGAYALQSEFGDYNPEVHTPEFVSEFRFVPDEKQTPELEEAILERWKKEKDRSPAQVEYSYLAKVKTFEMYGVDKHIVMGKDGREYCLGLDPVGLWVMEGDTKIGEFSWTKTEKTKFDGKKFTVIVKEDGDNGMEIEHTFSFWLPNKKAAKHLWKCALEHHAFFHTTSVPQEHTNRQSFFRMGSRFRHTGKTAAQIATEARPAQQVQFERRPSQRFSRRSTIRRHPAGTGSNAESVNKAAAAAKSVVEAVPLKSAAGTTEVLASHTISPPIPARRLASIPQSPQSPPPSKTSDTSCEVLATTFLSVSDAAPPLPPRLGMNERSPSLSEIANRDIRPPSSHTLIASPTGISGGRTQDKPPTSPTKPIRTYQFDYTPPISTAVAFDQVKLPSSGPSLLPLKSEEFRHSRGALDAVDEKSSTLQQAPASGTLPSIAATNGGYQHHASYLDRVLPPREINGFKLKTVEKDPQQPKELVSILKNTEATNPSYKMSSGARHPSNDSGRASPPSISSGSPSPTAGNISGASLAETSFDSCDTAPLLMLDGSDDEDCGNEPQPTPLLPMPPGDLLPSEPLLVSDCFSTEFSALLLNVETNDEPAVLPALQFVEPSQNGSNGVSRSESGASAGSNGTVEKAYTPTAVSNPSYQQIPWLRPDVVPHTIDSTTTFRKSDVPSFSFKQEPEKIQNVRRVITTEL